MLVSRGGGVDENEGATLHRARGARSMRIGYHHRRTTPVLRPISSRRSITAMSRSDKSPICAALSRSDWRG